MCFLNLVFCVIVIFIWVKASVDHLTLTCVVNLLWGWMRALNHVRSAAQTVGGVGSGIEFVGGLIKTLNYWELPIFFSNVVLAENVLERRHSSIIFNLILILLHIYPVIVHVEVIIFFTFPTIFSVLHDLSKGLITLSFLWIIIILSNCISVVMRWQHRSSALESWVGARIIQVAGSLCSITCTLIFYSFTIINYSMGIDSLTSLIWLLLVLVINLICIRFIFAYGHSYVARQFLYLDIGPPSSFRSSISLTSSKIYWALQENEWKIINLIKSNQPSVILLRWLHATHHRLAHLLAVLSHVKLLYFLAHYLHLSFTWLNC